MKLIYQDTLTFVSVESGGYSNKKTSTQQVDVPAMFIQNTGFSRSQAQDAVDADAICYPDPESAFIQEKFNRLEGLYVLAPLFGAGDEQSWYKVVESVVNRDHLLTNKIDNIELRLKKTKAIAGVS